MKLSMDYQHNYLYDIVWTDRRDVTFLDRYREVPEFTKDLRDKLFYCPDPECPVKSCLSR